MHCAASRVDAEMDGFEEGLVTKVYTWRSTCSVIKRAVLWRALVSRFGLTMFTRSV